MSLAITKTSKPREKAILSPGKMSELAGLLLLFAGVFLALALASYHPDDPSLFHKVSEEVRPKNWTGPLGAHVAAVAYSFFGLSCLLIPFLLVVTGWKRLRPRSRPRVVGRGFGAVLLLAATPALLQLLLGRIAWRGGSIAAGGAFGQLLRELLDKRLDFWGTLTVLVAATACGTALVVQSTLGNLLAAWRDRMRRFWQEQTLSRERRRERREKERVRKRIITKHMQRVVEEKQKREETKPMVKPAQRSV
ncbi:MAG TPA: DNA translocase FtsK 4TM domain-containing protein, partial [Thermoanaerobaculia bacterium]|nr:DNA translocase FtsK 4TM domain-containing protein [Thermoanaerobaculia bacterium]